MKNLTVILCCFMLSVSSIQAQFMDSKAERQATEQTSQESWTGGRAIGQNLTPYNVEILDQANGVVTIFETDFVADDIQNIQLPSGTYTVNVSLEGILVCTRELIK